MKVRVLDGRVSLEHIFMARLRTARKPPTKMVELTYRRLIKVARETGAEADVCRHCSIILAISWGCGC
jgi:hypothetical protein